MARTELSSQNDIETTNSLFTLPTTDCATQTCDRCEVYQTYDSEGATSSTMVAEKQIADISSGIPIVKGTNGKQPECP